MSTKNIDISTKIKPRELTLCALFTALTAIGAFIQIPVPFMDYFTLQFLFVTLAGMLLGSRMGSFAVGTYVVMGLLGIPVFAAGGGIQYIFRPSFGYLIGFVVTAFVVGFLCEKIKIQTFNYYLAAAFIGMFITYTIGFAYKYFMLNFYMHQPTGLWAITAASLPLDIPGDILLCIISSLLAVRLRKALRIL